VRSGSVTLIRRYRLTEVPAVISSIEPACPHFVRGGRQEDAKRTPILWTGGASSSSRRSPVEYRRQQSRNGYVRDSACDRRHVRQQWLGVNFPKSDDRSIVPGDRRHGWILRIFQRDPSEKREQRDAPPRRYVCMLARSRNNARVSRLAKPRLVPGMKSRQSRSRTRSHFDDVRVYVAVVTCPRWLAVTVVVDGGGSAADVVTVLPPSGSYPGGWVALGFLCILCTLRNNWGNMRRAFALA